MNLDALRCQLRGQMPDFISTLRAKVGEHAADIPRREAGYSIQNAAGNEAVVRIYDEIWTFGINASDLARDLDAISAPEIRVEINSPGGDVFDGIAIYNALRNHPAKVTTRVDGLAASIASVIAQAGDHRIMVQSSQMMIHNAWGAAIGDHQDHAEMSALLAQQDDIIAGIYATRSGGDKANFRALMDAETWLSDERAVAEGLADEILVPASLAADSNSKLINLEIDGKALAQVVADANLKDKIAFAVSAVEEAVSSSEQVSAVRADVGKTLSTVNRESLNGLRDTIARIDDLLNDKSDAPVDPDIEAKRLALAMESLDFAAVLPPRLI